MLRRIFLATLAVLALGSCAGPDDQRYYAIGGSGTDPLLGMQGAVYWAEGQRVSPTGAMYAGATDDRLLTLIFLTPGATGNGAEGESMGTGGVVATFHMTNGLPPGKVDADVKWDKRKDEVDIDGTVYDRSKGTLFVIVKSPGHSGEVWQLVLPSGRKKTEDLVNFAKNKLPSVKALQDVTFSVEEIRKSLHVGKP